MVVKDNANPVILDTYDDERRDHAWTLIEMALNLGQLIQPIDPILAAQRDAFFLEVNKEPVAIQALQDDMSKFLVYRSLDRGLIVANDSPATAAGKMLIQPQVVGERGRKLLDDCIGAGFSIIGYDCDPAQALSELEIARWTQIGASVVSISSISSELDGFDFLDESLELGNWIGETGPVIMLVRPDRFCMACAKPADAEDVLRLAYDLLTPPGRLDLAGNITESWGQVNLQ